VLIIGKELRRCQVRVEWVTLKVDLALSIAEKPSQRTKAQRKSTMHRPFDFAPWNGASLRVTRLERCEESGDRRAKHVTPKRKSKV
jgi:hypothetical protein